MYRRIPDAILESFLSNLSFHRYSFTDLMLSMINCSTQLAHDYKIDFIRNINLWLDHLSTIPDADESLRSWVHEAAKSVYAQELESLTHPSHGFHYNASKATLDQIEDFSLTKLENIMQIHSPRLYDLVYRLLASDMALEARRPTSFNVPESRIEEDDDLSDDEEDYWAHVDGIQLEDLFEDLSYGDSGFDDDNGKDLSDGLTAQERKRRKAAILKRSAVRRVRCFMIISVLLVTTNQRCNAFGGTFGFFFHSKNVPQSVIQVLHRFGLSDSAQSIHNAINSMSKKAKERMFRAGRTMLCSIAYDNFDFNSKTDAPTVERDRAFMHAISATLIPLAPGVCLDDLRCSAEVYAKLGLDLENPRAKAHWTFKDLIGIRSTPLVSPAQQLSLMAPPPARIYNSRQARQCWHILAILIEHGGEAFSKFKRDLGKPVPVFPLPVHKTQQIPLTAMALNQSTLDGNIRALYELNNQCGTGVGAVAGTEIPAVSLNDMVRLVHGDLGTLEKIESLMLSRRIEKSAEDRLQYVVPVMGLFHLKMAVVDALWKTYIEPKDARVDSQSIFGYIGILRPKETGKFVSKPGFRRMHDIIHHITQAAVLDCWRLAAMKNNPAWVSLEAFASSEPTWENIQQLASQIVETYIAGVNFPAMRRLPPAQRDRLFENACLRNRDFLDYIELCHAINWGDVGRIEELLIPLTCLCQSTAKTKYATYLIQHMGRMQFVYPEKLKNIIRKNWLVNPSGQPDGFRPVDWLVELNNLYTKVIYGGSFSNRTLELMLKQSPLIEVFREVHRVVNDAVWIRHRTTRHAPPNMRRTLERLKTFMADGQVHEFVVGREGVKYEIPDKFRESLDILNIM